MNNNKWYQKWMAIDQFSYNNVCFVLQLHNNLCNTRENYEISDNFLGNWHCLSPYDAFSHNLPSNLSVVMPQHDEIRNLDLRDVTFIDATEQIRFRKIYTRWEKERQQWDVKCEPLHWSMCRKKESEFAKVMLLLTNNIIPICAAYSWWIL